MRITIGDYIIRPYQNGLCWTIDHYEAVQKKDGSVEMEWKNAGKFPSTLRSAVEIVSEMALIESDKDIKGSWKEVEKAINAFKKALLDKITVATMTSRKR